MEKIKLFDSFYVSPRTNRFFYLIFTLIWLSRFIDSLIMEPKEVLIYITTLNFIAVGVLFILLTIYSFSKYKSDSKFANFLKIYLHISSSFSFLVIIFYWTVLPIFDLNRIKSVKNVKLQNHWFVELWNKHLLAPMGPWLVVLTCRTKLDNKNLKFLAFVMGSGMALNFSVCMIIGRAVYPGMDWVSLGSYVQVAGASSLCYLGFVQAKDISQKIERLVGRSEKKKV